MIIVVIGVVLDIMIDPSFNFGQISIQEVFSFIETFI